MNTGLLNAVSKNIDKPTNTEIMAVIPRAGEKLLDVITRQVHPVQYDIHDIAQLIADDIRQQRYKEKRCAAEADTPQITQFNYITINL